MARIVTLLSGAALVACTYEVSPAQTVGSTSIAGADDDDGGATTETLDDSTSGAAETEGASTGSSSADGTTSGDTGEDDESTGGTPIEGQFQVLDLTYTASANNVSNAYNVDVLPGVPQNWQSPVDYASGTVHVELDILDKPSDVITYYNICFNLEFGAFACMPYSAQYTGEGSLSYWYPFSAFYTEGPVDWSRGVKSVSIYLKNQDEEVQLGTSELFYPYSAKVSVTVVPPGDTYVPPE